MAGFWCEYLIDKLRDLEPENDEELDEGERKEAQEAIAAVERMTAYLEGRLVGFSDETAAKIESLFKEAEATLEDQFEHFYVRETLTRIPKMVARTLKLSQIVPRKAISSTTDVYLREATRTYVYGFWDASVALCRAAIEQALREAVKEQIGRNAETLRELVEASLRWGLLDKPSAHLADKVVSAGNRVLHREPTDDQEAWDVLCAARGVLLRLFASD